MMWWDECDINTPLLTRDDLAELAALRSSSSSTPRGSSDSAARTSSEVILESERVPSTSDPAFECCADDLPDPDDVPDPDLSNWDLFELFPETKSAALNANPPDASEILDCDLCDGGRDLADDDLRDTDAECWLMELCSEKYDAVDAGDDGLSIAAGFSQLC